MVFPASALAGQSAMGCINVQRDSDNTYFKNSCNNKVTVAWCSTTRKINGKQCGQSKSDWNKYYTQMFVFLKGRLLSFDRYLNYQIIKTCPIFVS